MLQSKNATLGVIVASSLLGGMVTLGVANDVFAESMRPMVDAGIGSYTSKAGVAGEVVIAGSDTMQPIIANIASAFREWQPGVKIAVQGGGTDTALMQFLQDQSIIRRGDAAVKPGFHQVSGHVALLAASRPLTQEERQDFLSRYGYEVTEVPIALDAIAVYVNHQNPIEGLALEQLDAIFSQDRKRGLNAEIVTWGQLGLKNDWAQQSIHRYGQDKRSGTRAIFIHKVLQDGELRPDVQIKSGPASEILALSNDILGIGFASIGFKASTVRILPLAERPGAVFVVPTSESVADGSYPLSRLLYLYTKKDPKAGLAPAILEFLKFINSREGQTKVAKTGAFPLSAQQAAKNLQVLTGTTVVATAPKTEFHGGTNQ